jgi:hypothetical protein
MERDQTNAVGATQMCKQWTCDHSDKMDLWTCNRCGRPATPEYAHGRAQTVTCKFCGPAARPVLLKGSGGLKHVAQALEVANLSMRLFAKDAAETDPDDAEEHIEGEVRQALRDRSTSANVFASIAHRAPMSLPAGCQPPQHNQ